MIHLLSDIITEEIRLCGVLNILPRVKKEAGYEVPWQTVRPSLCNNQKPPSGWKLARNTSKRGTRHGCVFFYPHLGARTHRVFMLYFVMGKIAHSNRYEKRAAPKEGWGGAAQDARPRLFSGLFHTQCTARNCHICQVRLDRAIPPLVQGEGGGSRGL